MLQKEIENMTCLVSNRHVLTKSQIYTEAICIWKEEYSRNSIDVNLEDVQMATLISKCPEYYRFIEDCLDQIHIVQHNLKMCRKTVLFHKALYSTLLQTETHRKHAHALIETQYALLQSILSSFRSYFLNPWALNQTIENHAQKIKAYNTYIGFLKRKEFAQPYSTLKKFRLPNTKIFNHSHPVEIVLTVKIFLNYSIGYIFAVLESVLLSCAWRCLDFLIIASSVRDVQDSIRVLWNIHILVYCLFFFALAGTYAASVIVLKKQGVCRRQVVMKIVASVADILVFAVVLPVCTAYTQPSIKTVLKDSSFALSGSRGYLFIGIFVIGFYKTIQTVVIYFYRPDSGKKGQRAREAVAKGVWFMAVLLLLMFIFYYCFPYQICLVSVHKTLTLVLSNETVC
ncbi:hypothetical protein NECID01_0619 [Nematocida sp. AWRm77]|nr:hypothetical protein NECID01_0619 [Nematocida sp. AWRm77]